MNKTLFGLALLTYNWEHGKKDIFDSYIPLICNNINNKRHKIVTRDIVQSDLLTEYGISISLGACENILKRMTKNEILSKNQGEFHVDIQTVSEISHKANPQELNTAFTALVWDLQNYSRNTFGVELTIIETEEGLINFFKDNDLDLLFANNNGQTVLPNVKESKKAKYIIAKYITDLQTKDALKFSLVLKLAKGYAIASLITYDDIQHYTGNLEDVEIYLDAPIIFNLLGLNGDSNLKLSQELIASLKTNRAKLYIFDINHGEVINTIQDAIKRLNSKDFDITKSSRVLKTAIREKLSSQQLQIKLNQLDNLLSSDKIVVKPSPSLLESEKQFQINEELLTESIKELYKKNPTQVIPWHKVNQIERDVESVSNIFKLRKRSLATSLKNSKAILLTSNEQIAYASKIYEKNNWKFKSIIPVCVTDIFLSTILWANYPTKNENLNIKQLISECYNITELDNRLLNRFYEDITKMHKENKITNEQFYLLNASNLTYALLENKTLNDIDEYTDKTPQEILEDLQSSFAQEVIIEKNKLSKIDTNIRKFAKFCGKSFFISIALSLILIAIWLKALNPIFENKIFKYSTLAIACFLAIFGILRWMELIPTKSAIETKVEDFIFNKLKNVLTQD